MGCNPWGPEQSDTTERLPFPFSLSRIGEGNGNPLQCSCLENPRDGGAWWAAVYGVAQNRRRLKRLSSSSSSTHTCIAHSMYTQTTHIHTQVQHGTYMQHTCDTMHTHTYNTHSHWHTRLSPAAQSSTHSLLCGRREGWAGGGGREKVGWRAGCVERPIGGRWGPAFPLTAGRAEGERRLGQCRAAALRWLALRPLHTCTILPGPQRALFTWVLAIPVRCLTN